MNNITEIKQEIENNLTKFYSFWKENKDIEYFENDFFSYIYHKKSPWPKFILNKPSFKKDFSRNLSEITKLINTKQAPTNWIINSDFVEKFSTYLKQKNFKPIVKWIGMYMQLENQINFSIPKKFVIKKVKTTEELQIWIDIVNTEIYKKNNIKINFFKNALNNNLFNIYLGYYDNTAVATSLIFKTNNYAGLYLISTKKEYRKKGLGSAITKKAIADIYNAGTKKIILHATNFGKNIYKKMGFSEYNKIYIFNYSLQNQIRNDN